MFLIEIPGVGAGVNPLIIARHAVPSCTSLRIFCPWLKFGHLHISDKGIVRFWHVEGPWIAMRISYGSVTGPAGLLGAMGPLVASYGPNG